MITVTLFHNIVVIVMALDYNCIRGIWTPGQLLILLNFLIQFHHGTSLVWWRILSQIYLSDLAARNYESIVFSLSPKVLTAIYILFLVASTMSDVFCILFNSVPFEAIISFSSCGLLLFVAYYTSVFVKSIQEIREATEPSQMGRNRSLLSHTSPNLGSNPPESENRKGLEKLMKLTIKVLLGVAFALFSVGVVDIVVTTPLETLVKVQNPEVYKLSWFIPPLLFITISLSTVFLSVAWIPVCSPNRQENPNFKSFDRPMSLNPASR
jgi:hypothetical protein